MDVVNEMKATVKRQTWRQGVSNQGLREVKNAKRSRKIQCLENTYVVVDVFTLVEDNLYR